MKKLIEFIKRIFIRKTLQLNEGKTAVEENFSKQKESFLANIVVEENCDNVSVLQIRLEEGLIEEEKLNNEQIKEMKDLYYAQIINLVNSINDYKIKLNQSA